MSRFPFKGTLILGLVVWLPLYFLGNFLLLMFTHSGGLGLIIGEILLLPDFVVTESTGLSGRTSLLPLILILQFLYFWILAMSVVAIWRMLFRAKQTHDA